MTSSHGKARPQMSIHHDRVMLSHDVTIEAEGGLHSSIVIQPPTFQMEACKVVKVFTGSSMHMASAGTSIFASFGTTGEAPTESSSCPELTHLRARRSERSLCGSVSSLVCPGSRDS